MTRIETAAKLLDVGSDLLNEFDAEDTFNPGNQISGAICRQSDHRYGALVITSVNGHETTPQVIYCTPKLHYPFGKSEDGDRSYHWPKDIRQVVVYPKLDGTNLCAYSYADAAGNRFLTFKTRLTPIVQESKFGPFQSMWDELMKANPGLIPAMSQVLAGEFTVSFEMYGYRNRHLILYTNPLDAKMLFFVQQKDGTPYPCHLYTELDPWALKPVLDTTGQAGLSEGLTKLYEVKRDEAESQNHKVQGDDGTDLIEGTEGFVFYILDGLGKWNLLKCKPSSVEDIHWVGDTIPLSRITPTAWNGLESCPGGVLTVEYVRELLLEEFTLEIVNASQTRIEKAVDLVNGQVAWRDAVKAAYLQTGLDWVKDGKPTVMRAMSKMFDSSKIRQVFSALRGLGIATEV